MSRFQKIRLLNRDFLSRAQGFGPRANFLEKAWRAVQLFFWYVPGSRRIHGWMDRFVHPDPKLWDEPPYRGVQSCSAIVSDTVQVRGPDDEAVLDVEVVFGQDAEGPLPVVIYSVAPSWGARHPSADAIAARKCFVEAGYAAIWVRHTLNDDRVLPHDIDDVDDRYAYIALSARDYELARGHFDDIHAVLDRLEEWNAEGGRFEGRFDMTRVGISGHSFAARTSFVVSGALLHDDLKSYKDDRIRAAACYTQAPAADPHLDPERCRDIDIPTLHVGGTRDVMWSSPTLPADSARAYEKITAARTYRLMLTGADHVSYPGGRVEMGVAGDRDKLIMQWTYIVTLAFWDAHLRGDAGAENWLKNELPQALGRDGSFKWKDAAG